MKFYLHAAVLSFAAIGILPSPGQEEYVAWPIWTCDIFFLSWACADNEPPTVINAALPANMTAKLRVRMIFPKTVS